MDDQIGDEKPLDSRRWTVLIVDDEPDIRDSFRELLEGEGYTVMVARNGNEALDIMRRSRRPLAVLLDLMMPEMRGDALIEALIREHRLPGKHAIILVTASPPTVPRSLMPVLQKLGIPIKNKALSPDQMVAALEEASARITEYQARPW